MKSIIHPNMKGCCWMAGGIIGYEGGSGRVVRLGEGGYLAPTP